MELSVCLKVIERRSFPKCHAPGCSRVVDFYDAERPTPRYCMECRAQILALEAWRQDSQAAALRKAQKPMRAPWWRFFRLLRQWRWTLELCVVLAALGAFYWDWATAILAWVMGAR